MSDTNTDIQELFQTSLETANKHLEAGDLEGASKLYKHLLEIAPNNHEVMFMWALASNTLGDQTLSEKLIKKAIGLDKRHWEYHVHLGNLLNSQGRFPRAEKSYRAALALRADVPEALFGLSNILIQSNKHGQALQLLKQLEAQRPDFPDVQKTLGTVLFMTGNLAESVQHLEKALKQNPADDEAIGNLAAIKHNQGEIDQAITLYHQLLDRQPTNETKRCELINILHTQGRIDEAESLVNKGLALSPDSPALLDQEGIIKLAANDTDGAIENFTKITTGYPDIPAFHTHLGMALLTAGNYEKGWSEYEWRLLDPNYPSENRNFPRPKWDGSAQPNATLLLYTEQGAGDAIQFVRFIKQVKEKVAKVILACPPSLETLFSDLDDVDHLITEGQIPDFQFHLHLMSLPSVLGITLDNLPAESPYLKANAEKSKAFKERLAQYDGLKVGLVTSGNPAQKINPQRMVPADKIAPLLEIENITLLSLQKTPQGFEAPAYPTDVVPLSNELNTYADTMAAIENLDVVVTVCTSIAHLAGALGKPTFVMLAKSADWRWMLKREDSPWYPSARLFRQNEAGVWDDVISNVKNALADMK